MHAVRTPEDRFQNLPDFPYRPRYVDDLPGFDGIRLAYVDEGPADAGRVFLCLHGEPTWSYLYRRMIPVFAGAGARVVAPDLIGFGRSDKPVDDKAYSFDLHRRSLLRLVERLDLQGIVLVVQDWGGLIGLTLPVDAGFRSRLAGLLVMNTTLATGEPPSDGFLAWRAFAAERPDLPVGEIMGRAVPHLTAAERAAYDAPFPSLEYKAGARTFPQLVMTDPDMAGVSESIAAERFWAQEWAGPSLMAIGMTDPVLGPDVMMRLHKNIRGCPPPMEIADAGHFVQEWGGPIAEAAVRRLL